MEEVSDMLEFLAEMIKMVYSPEVLTFCWCLVMNVNMDSTFSVSKNRSATRAQSHEMQNQLYHRTRGTIGRYCFEDTMLLCYKYKIC